LLLGENVYFRDSSSFLQIYASFPNCTIMKFLLISAFVAYCLSANALQAQPSIQTPRQVDSLLRITSSTISDTIRIHAMLDLAEYYGRIRKIGDSVVMWAKRAEALSAANGYRRGLGMAMNHLGATQMSLGNTAVAQEYFFKVLKIAEEDNDNEIYKMAYGIAGLLSLSQGKNSEAREYLFKALNAARELGDKKRIAFAFGNIAETYISLGQYDRALEYLLKALDMKEEFDDKTILSGTLLRIGAVYSKLGQYARAKECCLQALSLALEVNAPREVVGSRITLAMVDLAEHRYAKAIITARRALTNADSVNPGAVYGNWFTGRSDVLQTLSAAYDSLGNHKEALYYFRQFIALRDTRQNSELVLKTDRLKQSYESEKRTKLQQAEQARQTFVRNVLIVGFAIMLVASLIFGWLFQQKQQANAEILRQQRILEDQSTEIEISNTALHEKNIIIEQDRTLLARERERSERLLLSVLPAPIAERMKAGETRIAEHFAGVTVLFADIVGFTKRSANVNAQELVELLDALFSALDLLAAKHGLEKIKTIGDAYMVVCGVPVPIEDHAERVALFALEIHSILDAVRLRWVLEGKELGATPIRMRIGIHTGEAVAGVIGTSKFSYDLWGDTVNTASRMESHGETGRVHVSEEVYEVLKDTFVFEERGEIDVKGKGAMQTWFLVGTRL
jgi:class 3 adenylate cyclase